MPTFVPATRTGLVEIIGTLLGNEAVNTLFVQFATTITEAILTTLADTIKDWWVNNNMSHISDGYTFTSVRATDLTSDSGPSVLKTYTPVNGGTSDATRLPGNVTLAQKFATTKRGRSFRGRNFLAGVPNTALLSTDHNQVTGTFITNILNDWTELYAHLAAMTPVGTWVVCSKFSGGAPRTSAVLTPVVAVEINPSLDSMRRRLDQRGA